MDTFGAFVSSAYDFVRREFRWAPALLISTLLFMPKQPACAEDAPGYRWISNLEQGLSSAADRKAPIFAFFWDYN